MLIVKRLKQHWWGLVLLCGAFLAIGASCTSPTLQQIADYGRCVNQWSNSHPGTKKADCMCRYHLNDWSGWPNQSCN